jgi:hypothetical protein
VLEGVGPGSYSSRAFRTFVLAETESQSNVTEGFVAAIPPPPWAAKFLMPLLDKPTYLFGSSTVDGPFSSYLSLLAEVGILGFICYLWLYLTAVKKAWSAGRAARVEMDALTFAISFAFVGGVLLLFQMALFDNWFEVSRVSISLWLLFVPLAVKRSLALTSSDPTVQDATSAY